MWSVFFFCVCFVCVVCFVVFCVFRFSSCFFVFHFLCVNVSFVFFFYLSVCVSLSFFVCVCVSIFLCVCLGFFCVCGCVFHFFLCVCVCVCFGFRFVVCVCIDFCFFLCRFSFSRLFLRVSFLMSFRYPRSGEDVLWIHSVLLQGRTSSHDRIVVNDVSWDNHECHNWSRHCAACSLQESVTEHSMSILRLKCKVVLVIGRVRPHAWYCL